jgi:hypothetical protein
MEELHFIVQHAKNLFLILFIYVLKLYPEHIQMINVHL